LNAIQERVLALAGVFQSARLAQRIARTNTNLPTAFAASIYSVVKTDADTTLEIFGGGDARGVLLVGLESLRDKLGGNTDPDDFEVARYVAGIIELTRKLNRDSRLMGKLSDGIDRLAAQYPPDPLWLGNTEIPEGLIAGIASLYSETISTLSPRIIVNGEEPYLKQEATVNQIRASLMAGVRAAHLWWQLGGRRWHILFRRSQIAQTANELLSA
jgi:high frequency lysogenization protein